MSGLYYPPTELSESMGISPTPGSTTAAAGLAGVQRGIQGSDVFALQQMAVRQIEGIAPPPAPRAAPAPEPTAYFSPSTGKMFAGGIAFDQRDVQSAFRAAQQFTAAGNARPPTDVPDWQPLSRTSYDTYLTELRTPRGFLENVGIGARGAVGGIVGGVGRGLQMLGATDVGPAIAGFGEAISGQDDFDKQRSALIQQSNSLFSNVLDAAAQGLPSLGLGALAAFGGALVGGPAGAAAGLSLATARTAGAVGGLISSSFPQQLNTFYEAAKNAKDEQGRPVYDPDNDPRVQATILGAAIGTTALDVFAPARIAGGLSKALTDAAQEAGVKAVTGMARARAVGGGVVRGGIDEAVTEATQTLAERAVFDPEFRRQLSVQDWKAIGPYIASKYGEDILISAGAGAILGGGFGGAGRVIETRGSGSRERNVLDPEQTTAVQGKPPEGTPPAAPGGTPSPSGTPGAPPAAGTPPVAGVSAGVAPTPSTSPAAGAMDLTQTGYLQAYAQRMPDPLGAAGFGGGFDTFDRMVSGPAPGTEAPLSSYIYPGPVLTEPEPTIQPRTPQGVIPGAPVAAPYTPAPTAPIPSGTTQPITLVAPGADALRAQRGLTATAQQRQVEQDIQARANANAGAPRPDVLYDPADPGSTQRAMQALGVSIDEVLGLRDPMRAMAGAPVTLRDVNEAAALLGRTRGSGAPVARPTPEVSASLAQVMQDAGLTTQDVVAARNRLRSGPITYEDVRVAARRKGVELPVRLAQIAAPEPTVAPEPTPTPTPAASKLKKGKPRAAQVREVEQGGVGQRPGDSGQVAGQRVNRDIPAQDQTAGGQTGGGNLFGQSGAPAQRVVKPKVPKGMKPRSTAQRLEADGIALTDDDKKRLDAYDAKIKAYEDLVTCLKS